MSDNVTPNGNGSGSIPDSVLLGVSVRAWIAIILVATICANHLSVTAAVLIEAVIKGDFAKVGTYITITEPLYSLTIMAVGFFFGQKTSKQ